MVPLFVGNLKENLSQCMYERLLTRKLGEQLKWESIEVIYYESGCLVLNFANFELAEEAYEKLRVSLLAWIVTETYLIAFYGSVPLVQA